MVAWTLAAPVGQGTGLLDPSHTMKITRRRKKEKKEETSTCALSFALIMLSRVHLKQRVPPFSSSVSDKSESEEWW